MNYTSTYSCTNLHWLSFAFYRRTLLLCILLVCCYTGFNQSIAISDKAVIPKPVDTIVIVNPKVVVTQERDKEYNDDEILITLNVPRIGSVEMMAYIYGEDAYLPVKDLFDFLKISNTLSAGLDSVYGTFINPASTYVVDKVNNRIIYQGNVFELQPNDLIRTETNLYLHSNYFEKVFGLECFFNFRALSITLNTKLELPAIREMQIELMRKNISSLKGERIADTTINRTYHMFRAGMMDWAISSNQLSTAPGFTTASLGIGAVVAGGETNLFLNYNSQIPLSLRQQYFSWRYVNNNQPALRQVTIGKLNTQSISSIFAPVTGIQVTNTPTTYRRSFGSYTLSNITQPGWTVELYINNVLLNYTKADAAGFFRFEVPLVYGSSILILRFYGPLGEEQTQEQTMNIPFNFVPVNQLEYTITAGVVNNDSHGVFTRALLNYGLTKRITVGGGMEYLSTISSGKVIPFVTASARLGSFTLLSAEHAYGVRSKASLNFHLFTNLQFDVNYTRFNKHQVAVLYNYLEERRISISMPFRTRTIASFTRFILNQYSTAPNPLLKQSPIYKFTSAELLLSAIYKNISSNFTTSALFNEFGNPAVYSSFSLSFRIPGGIRLIPRAQYEFKKKNFNMLKAEGEKNISRNCYLGLYLEKDLVNNINYAGASFRYNLQFAQTSFSTRQSKQYSTTNESAHGSLVYTNKYLQAGNQANVGKGGLVIAPFLDMNCNGRRDTGEPKVSGLKMKVNGGRTTRNDKDTTFRIMNLEAYNSYYIELDKNSFDNVAWIMKKLSIRVAINANEVKIIEVPVAVVGEVSGSVLFKDNKGSKGLGRITIKIYNSDSSLAGQTVTEADGYFSFLGLAPGVYTARIDPAQLQTLNMQSPDIKSFVIKQGREGDVVDGLEFTLQMGK
ncbi:MAG: hypothetical protein ABIN89_01710 [Chitinophagaceae bacterium]